MRLTRSGRMPMQEAMSRFCITARIKSPSGVLVRRTQVPKTIATAKPITNTRL